MKKFTLVVLLTLSLFSMSFGYDVKLGEEIKFIESKIIVQHPENIGIRESWVDLGIKKEWGELVSNVMISDAVIITMMATYRNEKYDTFVTYKMSLPTINITNIEVINIVHINRE